MTRANHNDGTGITALLLNWIPGLRQRSDLDRLKYFETICVMAVSYTHLTLPTILRV